MGVMLQSKSTSLLFPMTLALLCSPRSNGTVVLLMALLICQLATRTVTVDAYMFGSTAALAVLFVTRIVEHPELAHMEASVSTASLLGLYTLRRNMIRLRKRTWPVFLASCSVDGDWRSRCCY